MSASHSDSEPQTFTQETTQATMSKNSSVGVATRSMRPSLIPNLASAESLPTRKRRRGSGRASSGKGRKRLTRIAAAAETAVESQPPPVVPEALPPTTEIDDQSFFLQALGAKETEIPVVAKGSKPDISTKEQDPAEKKDPDGEPAKKSAVVVIPPKSNEDNTKAAKSKVDPERQEKINKLKEGKGLPVLSPKGASPPVGSSLAATKGPIHSAKLNPLLLTSSPSGQNVIPSQGQTVAVDKAAVPSQGEKTPTPSTAITLSDLESELFNV